MDKYICVKRYKKINAVMKIPLIKRGEMMDQECFSTKLDRLCHYPYIELEETKIKEYL